MRRVPRSISVRASEPRRSTTFHQIPLAQQRTFALFNSAPKVADNTTLNSPSEESAATTTLESVLLGKNQDEEIRLQAMVKESAAQWNKQLDLQETFS